MSCASSCVPAKTGVACAFVSRVPWCMNECLHEGEGIIESRRAYARCVRTKGEESMSYVSSRLVTFTAQASPMCRGVERDRNEVEIERKHEKQLETHA